jgi:hypothetical protein
MFLKLIFECNVFKFNKDYYIQQKGLAMGCICGPSTANLYLYIKKLLQTEYGQIGQIIPIEDLLVKTQVKNKKIRKKTINITNWQEQVL